MSTAAITQKPTRRRFFILGLVAATTMINYLDRTVLGAAAPMLTKDLGLSAAMMGLVFSAFSWTYTAAQIPGGAVLDKLGVRLVYCLSIVGWSITVIAQGLAMGAASLIGARLAMGIAEAPCFPGASRVVATWFPQGERARATSIYTVGEYIGLAVVSPLLFVLMPVMGWRLPFVALGILGVAFGLFWYRAYREPAQDRHVNAAELALIEAGGGFGDKAVEQVPFSWEAMRRLLGFRQIWGAGIGQFAGNATLVFFLTWFPTYLSQERGMNLSKEGWMAAFPYMTAAVGILFGGWISDRLIRWTGSVNLGRKVPIVCGLLLQVFMILANYVESEQQLILVMAVAFFGQGMVGIGWTVISDIAPVGYAGITGGLFNFLSNMAGIVTPLAIGIVIAATGSFAWALTGIGVTGVLGAISYVLLIGDIRRLTITNTALNDT